jgi:Ser/Thr protein kinase RdoA (MazF antagonist)
MYRRVGDGSKREKLLDQTEIQCSASARLGLLARVEEINEKENFINFEFHTSRGKMAS